MSDLIKKRDAIEVLNAVDVYGDGIGFEVLSHAIRDVSLLPTVEAIPIEYIESTMNRWKEIIGYEESVDALRILIDNWKIERTEE